MMAQVLFFDIFFEKDLHLNAVEQANVEINDETFFKFGSL